MNFIKNIRRSMDDIIQVNSKAGLIVGEKYSIIDLLLLEYNMYQAITLNIDYEIVGIHFPGIDYP